MSMETNSCPSGSTVAQYLHLKQTVDRISNIYKTLQVYSTYNFEILAAAHLLGHRLGQLSLKK